MPKKKAIQPDLLFTNHGSVVTLQPLTDTGKEWVKDNIPLEDWQSSERIAVEPRYVANIVEGAQGDGLEVSLRG